MKGGQNNDKMAKENFKWHSGGEARYNLAIRKWKRNITITTIALVVVGIGLYFSWQIAPIF